MLTEIATDYREPNLMMSKSKFR